jgi:hypothetical protein
MECALLSFTAAMPAPVVSLAAALFTPNTPALRLQGFAKRLFTTGSELRIAPNVPQIEIRRLGKRRKKFI